MNVHIRVILSICLIIHSSVLLIVMTIWSNVDCMIITIEIIIHSTTLHVSLSIRSDTSIHSHPHSMLLLTSTPLILIYLLISVSSIIELDPMLIQSFLSNHLLQSSHSFTPLVFNSSSTSILHDLSSMFHIMDQCDSRGSRGSNASSQSNCSLLFRFH